MFEWYWLFLFFGIIHLWIFPLYTIYVHRCSAHRQACITPAFENLARICLWLTGFEPIYMSSSLKYWVATHRKHHCWSDTDLDPHSPLFYSSRDVVFGPSASVWAPGAAYHLSDKDLSDWASDIKDSTDDIISQIISKYSYIRWLVLPTISLLLFGWAGIIAAFIVMLTWYRMPMLFNLLSHKIGYRTQPPISQSDRSRNVWPLAIIFGGEELAANHHDDTSLANTAIKWYEFDLGYQWMRFYQWLGLIHIFQTKND